ncbi:hypothetical protein ULMA_13010 [Patiriisocius marinus]|uniref:Peptidase S8/S53 domain-containing protein n=1 Tax=Patiriisocius marinus TaxID=1397112 RepID=A0A5J4J0B2_9FLAO|nr:S8 family serine peptidase [Patiriisocius marinus]GER59193.1 hypothetical protein ULMA_13010 [Patiriisocius marinus]
MSLYAQNNVFYKIEFKEDQSVEILNTSVNNDNTLSITTDKANFNSFITGKPIYKFEKAFPLFTTPRLQRVYLIEVPVSYNITSFTQRTDVEQLVPYEEEVPILLSNIEPNDYIENLQEDRPNPSLDLIKAPLAWSITTGDPNIYIGIIDGDFWTGHEELQGKVITNLDDENPNSNSNTAFNYLKHGTQVSAVAAGNTDNGLGMAAIGYNTSIVTADDFGSVNRVKEISLIPGVKVINCSWIRRCSFDTYEDIAYQEILDSGVLVVAGAGNGPNGGSCGGGHGYAYPASYDAVISVTGVGNRYDIGENNPLINPQGDWDFGIVKSWYDCHYYNPDNIPVGSLTHNDKVNVSAPGLFVQLSSIESPSIPLTEKYEYGIGTSMAAPFVSGLAALVFAANPNLTAVEVKDIIESTTDDIYHIPQNRNVDPNLDLHGKLGTGRINAFRAVKKAKCSEVASPEKDWAMQNSRYDMFIEPDIYTDEVFWQSEDIWVRNTNDGQLIQTHQNPEFDPSEPNYAYVEVTNNSCWETQENEFTTVTLYWAKASTSLSWPNNWDGSTTIPNPNGGAPIELGGVVGTMQIPSLKIGQSKILEFPWLIPNPEDYIDINPNPWHFCLLARITSHDDPMAIAETDAITLNVKNNNNLAWKNTTIVDLRTMVDATVGGVIAIANNTDVAKSYILELRPKADELGKPLHEEAEITVTLDANLLAAWQGGGSLSQDLSLQFLVNKKTVDGSLAQLQNIQLAPGEITTAYISFNFLTQELTDKKKFVYEVVQRDAVTNEIIGGETYIVRKDERPIFTANAGADKEIEKNENVTLQASVIDENATYNWYDPQGTLIYTGTDFTLSPDITKKYKLEIISDIDGLKDYDEVEVVVNPYKIESISPNPVSNVATIAYDAELANSAYLRVVNTNTGNEYNYILDINETEYVIDTTLFTIGSYVVALICNGEFQTSKILVKQ